MEKIYNLAYKLNHDLQNSLEYQILKEKEKQMLNDKICANLLKQYQQMQEIYQKDRSQDNLKKLHQIKLSLDENKLVKEYQLSYKNYQILIGKITDIVFEDFKSELLIDKIIKAK